MIVEAALGIAGGALIAAALAGFRRVRNWERAARVTAVAGAALTIVALAGLWVMPDHTASGRAVIGTALIATGGALYTLRARISAVTPLAGGLLLTYVTLIGGRASSAPLATSSLIVLLTGSLALPVIDAAAREWRGTRIRLAAAIVLWVGLSTALMADVVTGLIQRGVWLGATPGAAWAIAGWVTSSGGLLTRRGRPRAALIAIAALATAFGALNG